MDDIILARSALNHLNSLGRFKLLSGDELFNFSQMRWLVHGVIPAEGLVALYGASGSGKSFLALDMAFAIVLGTPWFEHRVYKASVTYICLEGESGMGKRVKARGLYFNNPAPDNLRFVIQPFNLLKNDVTELAGEILSRKAERGLIIIDTLNRAAPGADENSSIDMGLIIEAAKKLQSLTAGVVMLVHHTGKDITKGLRGHSSLIAALDGAIEVTHIGSRHEWSVAKSKDDVTGRANSFKLEIVSLGEDEDKNEITSCVVLSDGAKKILPDRRQLLRRNQKLAFAAMEELLVNSLHTGQGGAPDLEKCVGYNDAVRWISEKIPTDVKHQTERAKEAIGGLVEKGYLGIKGDWLWKI